MTATNDHSLPPIGAPATRALVAAGITDLDAVASHPADALRALHGVGPKAIRLLGEALAAQGLTFAPSAGASPAGAAGAAAPVVPAEVRAYADDLPPRHRVLFDRLQRIILDELPEAEMVISYQIPLYRVGKRHVGLNGRRPDGITLTTTSPDHIADFVRRHPKVKTNKASIALRFTDDVPDDDLRAVVRRAVRG